MKKKIIFLIIMFVLFKNNISALTFAGCDYSEVSRMKSLVSNINISYDYHINNNVAYYDVTLTNIMPNIYFVDSLTNKIYTYDDSNNGEIIIYNYEGQGGIYKFYSAKNECYGVALGSKYYKFPTYNKYYGSEVCKDATSFSLCQKWVDIKYSEQEFNDLVLAYKYNQQHPEDTNIQIVEYKSNLFDILINLYVNNYYYFLGIIIIICGLIILINRKKNKFKL